MKFRFLLLLALTSAWLVSPSTCRADAKIPSASVLLDQSLSTYDHAKTIQATVIFETVSAGKPTTTTIMVQAQNAPDGQLAHAICVTTTKGLNPLLPAEDRLSRGHLTAIYNGSACYYLYSSLKQYRVHRSADHFSDFFRPLVKGYLDHQGTLSASYAVLNQHPSYVLRGKANKGGLLYAVIDAADGSLRCFSNASQSGKESAGVEVTQLQLNTPLPASIPLGPPPDYKELVLPTNPAGKQH